MMGAVGAKTSAHGGTLSVFERRAEAGVTRPIAPTPERLLEAIESCVG